MRKPLLLPASFKEAVFADADIKRIALSVVRTVYGSETGLNRIKDYKARKFFYFLQSFTPETFSLAALKESLAAETDGHPSSRLYLEFLWQYRDLYAADDAAEAREVMGTLHCVKDGFGILNHPSVRSFKDVTFFRYYGHHEHRVFKTDNDYVKTILRDFFSSDKIKHTTYLDDGRFDRFVAIFARVFTRRGVSEPAAFDQTVLFDLIDEVRREPDDVKSFTCIVCQVYRAGVKSGGFTADGPYFTVDMVSSSHFTRFFAQEYTSRGNTFRANTRDRGWGKVMLNVSLPDPRFRPLMQEFLGSGKASNNEVRITKDLIFPSLEGVAKDWSTFEFTEDCFFHQVQFFRKHFKDEAPRIFDFAVGALRIFYLSLDKVSEGAFFRNAKLLTYSVLTTPRFIEYNQKGYVFTRYSPYDRIDSGERRVFIVHNFDIYKRSILRDDYIGVDLTPITNEFYRSLAWACITSTPKRLYRPGLACTLRHLLNYLVEIKTTPGYVSPDFERFTVWDAVVVTDHYEQISRTRCSYCSSMMEVRDFLRWAKADGTIKVDPVCFEYLLVKKKHKKSPTNLPVLSKEALVSLCDWMACRSKKESKYGQALIIMNLVLITPLRISHVCKLRKDELFFDSAINSYVFNGKSKGTRGGNAVIVMGPRATEFIDKAIELNRQLSEECPDKDLTDYLFLCRERVHFDVFSTVRFRKIFDRACSNCGLDGFTTHNLRATYMTSIYVEACENGAPNEFILKLFSYHKNNGTTLEHYVNHDEALAALTEFLKKGNDWDRTIYPDEIATVEAVINDMHTLIAEAEDDDVRARLESELLDYQQQLEDLRRGGKRKI